MPVEGLPNPHLHRICKRCRRWFERHEGSEELPPVTGFMSFVQWSAARVSGAGGLAQWRCFGCQQEARKNRQRFIVSLIFTIVMIVAVVVALWALGVIDLVRARNPQIR